MSRKNKIVLNIIVLCLFIIIALVYLFNNMASHNSISSLNNSDPHASLAQPSPIDNNVRESTNSPQASELDIKSSSNFTGKPTGNNYEFAQSGKMAVTNCLKYMFGGTAVSDFTSTLGQPEKKEDKEHFSRWHFKQGIEIDIIKVNDYPEITNYVYINDQCELQTDKKIGIGSTYDEVKLAYGKELNSQQSVKDIITIGISDMFFIICNARVSAIYITTNSFTQEYFGEFTPDRP